MPKPDTVDAYIASLEPHTAHIIEQVRDLMHAIDPEVVEAVKYGMPKFSYAGTYLFAGAWKKHLGLYPVYPADPVLEERIAPFRSGSDTVRFLYKDPIPMDLIEAIARARIAAP
ncbi:Uncharacterized conserved protein YdhG, YjbR/CyaY-like superfamily, DUF1801 family [Devosia enhydra]|uniref:Uncharacterized conserved protein YdhG, YjbR/CyaY-like superfamily, DUF1801 family n=1 Tax=Devosia enhydra TaxID=665118 RepID=A0A1K2HUT9_9HYPH|nr:DUF1801 domain-containing protein [Devosia enhydra]SFZ82276.1 Uncharacterized conserved protein YdhG, YjbR/CyaY-like superfamily, DUF1801 family [Devosia enhydra]